MAEQRGAGGIEVRAETRRAAEELFHGEGVRIGRIHLPLEALELS
jgi:hypothetical protein